LRVKSHESRTKDCLVNSAKIKGSNYNLLGGLDYKFEKTCKDQIRNILFWIWKRRRFLDNCLSPSSSAMVSIVNAMKPLAMEPLQSGGMFHATIMHARPLLCYCRKRLHPLAIKARGRIEQVGGTRKERRDRGEEDKEEKQRGRK
jgi:hypothetical protein